MLQRLLDVLDDDLEDREAAGEELEEIWLTDMTDLCAGELLDIGLGLTNGSRVVLLSQAPEVFSLGFRDLASRLGRAERGNT